MQWREEGAAGTVWGVAGAAESWGEVKGGASENRLRASGVRKHHFM